MVIMKVITTVPPHDYDHDHREDYHHDHDHHLHDHHYFDHHHHHHHQLEHHPSSQVFVGAAH